MRINDNWVAIRIALMDNAECWFDADMRRIERILHPQLAKQGSLSPSIACSRP